MTKTKTDKWWETRCPICGDTEGVDHQPSEGNTIRYCGPCKFQWSTELGEWMIIVLARDHIRKGMNHDTTD